MSSPVDTTTFATLYSLSFDPATGAYVIGANIGPWTNTITDDQSGTSGLGDGVEHAGESMAWDVVGVPVNYAGWTINGQPVIATGGGGYYLPSDDPNLSGLGTAVAGDYTYCYLRGTHIATPSGQQPVECLQIGDLVRTLDGRDVAVKWIGRRSHSALMARLNEQLPVCVAAGALADGVPQRDLYLSPDHALLVEGCLVHASALINGRTITRCEAWAGSVDYVHIETEAHEIVLAEGAPAETFMDRGRREHFDNHAEFQALYPDAPAMDEMALPRIQFARQLPRRIAAALAARLPAAMPG